MTSNYTLWDLPECIWQSIFGQTVSQSDVCRLDSACCNHKLRRLVLCSMASACVTRTNCLAMPPAYYKWALLRGLLLQRIVLPSLLATSPGVYKSLLRVNSLHLSELHIHGTYSNTDVISHVSKYCTGLKRLLLYEYEIDDSALTGLLCNNALEEVCFSGGRITGVGDNFHNLQILSNLMYLQLLYVAFEEQLFLQLISRCSKLRRLLIRGEKGMSRKSIVTAVRATPLGSSYALPCLPGVSSKVYTVVAERGTNLLSLSLMHGHVDDADMLVIVSHCCALRALTLFGCKLLTSTTVYNIARYCPLMEDLDLDGVDVDDAAVIKLVDKCLKLWGLSLPRSAGITDSSIMHVRQHCKALTHMQLYYNPPAVTAHLFPLFSALVEFVTVGYP
jgi:hypothetical protein